MNYLLGRCLPVVVLFSLLSTLSSAQIVVLQYRSVPQEHLTEFLHRETNYWAEVAKQAIDEGKMIQWELWQRFGGVDLQEGSYNFLFTNVFADKTALDQMSDIWNTAHSLPNVRLSDVETGSLSRVVHAMVASLEGGAGRAGQFIRVNYADVSDMNNYIRLENENWKPFISRMMEEEKTTCVGWAVLNVLYPAGEAMPFSGFSVDHYDLLSEAVQPTWDESVVFPNLTEYFTTNDRVWVQVYGLVKRVTALE